MNQTPTKPKEKTKTTTEQQVENIAAELDLNPNLLTVTEEGLVVDPDGEIVGVVTPDEFVEEKAESTEPPLMSEGFVNWLMAKRLKYDARHASAYGVYREHELKANAVIEKAVEEAKKTPEYIEAYTVMTNSFRMIEDANKARQFFAGYDPELGRYAAANLDGKSKTLKTPFGWISLRKNPDKLEIVDEASLIEWAKVAAPETLDVSFKISELPKESVDFMKKYPDMAAYDEAAKIDQNIEPVPARVPQWFDKLFTLKVGETKVTVSSNIEGVKK